MVTNTLTDRRCGSSDRVAVHLTVTFSNCKSLKMLLFCLFTFSRDKLFDVFCWALDVTKFVMTKVIFNEEQKDKKKQFFGYRTRAQISHIFYIIILYILHIESCNVLYTSTCRTKVHSSQVSVWFYTTVCPF